MRGKKIIAISLIINIILICIVCNFIKKDYLNNERIIIKTMTETENESQIETLNQSHQNYKEYIDASKKQLATAITNKGVATTADSTLEIMTANVNKIVTNPPASLISYDNTTSGLTSTNVQGAIDELNNSLDSTKSEIPKGINFEDSVDLASYGQSSPYITPTDGYGRLHITANTLGNALMYCANGTENSKVLLFVSDLPNATHCNMVYIPKGVKIYAYTNRSNQVSFIPLSY